MKNLFKLRGTLERRDKLILEIIGVVLLISLWAVLAEVWSVKIPDVDYTTELPSSLDSNNAAIIDSIQRADSIAIANATTFKKAYPTLPAPINVLKSFPSLHFDDLVVRNMFISIKRNLLGYFWAILIAIPIGFLVGLIPLFRGLFSRNIDSLRFLPLTALTGVFMTWFGIGNGMMVAFLAFGILVYLLPVVVQRIDEVKDVYLKTVFTLGATNWQTVKTVYFPAVLSKLSDDIRVLTAISWTYIIVAELVNKGEGGIGSLVYTKGKLGQIDKVFAILIIIVIIGFIQDRILLLLDKWLFPYKHKT